MSENARLDSFQAYATAFEEAFAADDWSHVDRHLTEDAVWSVAGAPPPFGGVWSGSKAVLDAIRTSVDGFDRRFDVRAPRILEGPTPIPGGIHMKWVVTYSRDGLPPVDLRGEEWDFFRDGKLEFHREVLHNALELGAFVAQNGAKLRPAR
jgi:hypothetical protein